MAFDRPDSVPIESGQRGAQVHLDFLLETKAEILRLQNFLALSFGGVIGVIAYDTVGLDSLAPEGTGSMTVRVLLGKAFYDSHPCDLLSNSTSGTISAPSSDPRIDLIAFDCDNEVVNIIEGVEDASPSVPATPADHLALGELLLRTGSTSILTPGTPDDSVNGFITDVRVFLNA